MTEAARGLHPQDLGIGILFERIREAVIVADVESGSIVLWNPFAERLFGYTADEAAGLPLEALIPPHLRAAHRGGFARYRATGHGALIEAALPIEVPALRSTGEEINVELTLSPLDGPDGGRFVLAVLRDATDRKRAEEEHVEAMLADLARRRAEAERARMEEIFARVPALIALTEGPDHVIIYANPPFLQVAAPRECLGRPVGEAFPELAAQGYVAALDHVYATAEPAVKSEAAVHRDRAGTSGGGDGDNGLFFNYALQPMVASDGSVSGLLIHAVEVTAQVQARREIEALAEQLRDQLAFTEAMMSSVGEGVYALDQAGHLTFMNPAAERLLGWSFDELRAHDMHAAIHFQRADGSPLPEEECPLMGVIRSGVPAQTEDDVFTRKDGSLLSVAYTSAPMVRDGQVVGAVLAFHDVTARKAVESLKDDFLATVAHDLKNPLAAISGVAQLLRRRLPRVEGPDGERLAEGLESIIATAARMASMVTQLLDHTRLQMERPLDLDLAPIDLVPLAERVALAARHMTERQVIRVQSSAPSLIAVCDAARAERVLDNLISNAVKYSLEPGEITLDLSWENDAAGAHAVIRVHDQGLGIPEEDLPYVFDRFYRAGNVRERIAGTGLGLASVRQIVEQHGGSVAAARNAGRGTIITVRLPMAGPTAGPPPEPAARDGSAT